MNGITRYIFRQLMLGMVLVTVGLTSVIWLTQSLRFVDMIVNRGLSAGLFVYLTMLLLPNFLSIILPIALFTVVVFTYSKMISDRELVVMRSAGLSQNALAKPAIVLSILVVIVLYAINLYLIPQSYQMFRELQWDIRYSYSHVLLQEGTFNTVSPGITVYLRERTSDGQLLGLLVHDGRDADKPVTIMATRGALVESEEGTRVIMFDGNRQEMNRKTNKLSTLFFDQYTVELKNTKRIEVARFREARERPLGELLTLDRDKLADPNNYGKFTVEGHKRLVSPLTALGFSLVGLACLISGAVSRRGQTRRIILAVTLVVVLQVTAMVLENLSAKQLELIPAMYVNALAPVVFGYLFMMRSPRMKRSRASTKMAAGTR